MRRIYSCEVIVRVADEWPNRLKLVDAPDNAQQQIEFEFPDETT